ncbi:MAG: non-canonical purine NTP pyrophosphatase, RdgB/HAM1 family [Hyphomicrobiales bacterium]|nr:MAG: non-canonical purine NTP pyrophosphatase, RdgB/HAM1 family [Hyphomicrobiales bacterium]
MGGKTRKLSEKRIVVATHNPGKLREINDLLAPYGLEAVSAGEFGLPEPVEDGLTFGANARIKAHAAAQGSGLPALADDSGLAVDALGGAPGIYSARWGGEGKDFGLAMRRVEDELQQAGAVLPEQRGARFVCALCLAWPDGHDELFEGTVSGHIVWPPRGTNGFGYDPIFVSKGRDISFGEMDPDEKHGLSHRADAFRQLTEACF